MKHIEVEVPHGFLVCQQNQHIFSSLLSATSISRKPTPQNPVGSKDQRNFLIAQAIASGLSPSKIRFLFITFFFYRYPSQKNMKPSSL